MCFSLHIIYTNLDLPITHSTDILMSMTYHHHRSCGEELMTINAHEQFDRYVNVDKQMEITTSSTAPTPTTPIVPGYQQSCGSIIAATFALFAQHNGTISSLAIG